VHDFYFHSVSKVVFIINRWFVEIVVLMTDHHLFKIIVKHVNFFDMIIIIIIKLTTQMHPTLKKYTYIHMRVKIRAYRLLELKL